MPPRIPQASHRHASPSGPWPWTDLAEEKLYEWEIPDDQDADTKAEPWSNYPAKTFPNWTRSRVERSGIGNVMRSNSKLTSCRIYHIDVRDNGQFSSLAENTVKDESKSKSEFWGMMQKRPEGVRVRALFIENLSGNVLQMLGTRYNIEPFFFSSSLNWIPSRYQEDVQVNQGDHITVTLTFLRTMPNPMTVPASPESGFSPKPISRAGTATIDTQAPLTLRSCDRTLFIDILAIHMVRRKDSSTIISYHPTSEWKSTSAQYLHSKVKFAGQSVYWGTIFKQSDDPTFVFLCMLWYALYAWDEALESLYSHICWLEARVLITNDIHLTRELHIIRASLLHYASLLEDFRKTVLFIQNTPNPAMKEHTDFEKSTELMDRECNTLQSEIERLEKSRKMQEMRLKNVMDLAFSSVNLQDSRDMQRLTEAALRDSAAMKQISYLTMVFLPATFVATAFGMNIKEVAPDTSGRLSHYFASALPLTAVTVWIMLALHTKLHHGQDNPETSFVRQLSWPLDSFMRLFVQKKKRLNDMV
ncbi:hypothetical protein BDQ12DRAFT_601934 [Crucibulum laeve]|uniref:Cora-like Mg2+ transporter protein-domain-containing protein n=1 Tax=Crucibulum laeve TaxID=68775 RepID=A0A5C3M6N7_9AGAR|nr:hypothetical protein BDQ12DRAFT_601934 [Crucibulum laeve]